MDVKTKKQEKKTLTRQSQEERRQEVPVIEFLVQVCVTEGGKNKVRLDCNFPQN